MGQHCDALCSAVIQLLLHHPHQLHQNCFLELQCYQHYSRQVEYLAPLFGTFLPKNKGILSCAGHALVKVFPLVLVPKHISGSSHSPSSTWKQTKKWLYISASKLLVPLKLWMWKIIYVQVLHIMVQYKVACNAAATHRTHMTGYRLCCVSHKDVTFPIIVAGLGSHKNAMNVPENTFQHEICLLLVWKILQWGSYS